MVYKQVIKNRNHADTTSATCLIMTQLALAPMVGMLRTGVRLDCKPKHRVAEVPSKRAITVGATTQDVACEVPDTGKRVSIQGRYAVVDHRPGNCGCSAGCLASAEALKWRSTLPHARTADH